MNTDLIQFGVLFLFILIGLPLYIFYRNRMVKMDGMLTVSYKRIVKVIWLNFFLNLIVFLYCQWVFISKFQFENYMYLMVFIILFLVIFYGNGIYITSILLTSYVEQFKQKTMHDMARDFLHGSLSHLMIYQSYFVLIALFSLMPTGSDFIFKFIDAVLVMLFGGVIGLLFTIMHLYNNTLKEQLYGVICVFLGTVFLQFIVLHTQMNYWLLFFISMSAIFIFCSVCILQFPSMQHKIKARLAKLG